MITLTEEQSILRNIYLHWIILLPRCVAQIASLGVPAYDRASIVILIPGRNVALQDFLHCKAIPSSLFALGSSAPCLARSSPVHIIQYFGRLSSS